MEPTAPPTQTWTRHNVCMAELVPEQARRDDTLLRLLPARVPGNPGRAEERLKEAAIVEMIGALPPPTRRPLVPWPYEERCIKLAEARQFAPLTAAYKTLPMSERYEWVMRAAECFDKETSEAWAEREPSNALAQMVHAQVLRDLGWAARGSGAAETVGEFEAMTFRSYLRWGQDLCERAATVDPTDVTPLVVGQQMLLGTASGRDDVLAWAQRWQRLDTFNLQGNVALLNQLAPKWFGVDGDLLGLATHLHQRAPDGHPVHALVASALLDSYEQLVYFDDADVTAANVVFRDNVDLLVSAHRSSLGSPAWRTTSLEGWARNEFLFCLYFGDANDLAWDEVRALRGHYTPYPWTLKSDDPARLFDDCRAWLIRFHVV